MEKKLRVSKVELLHISNQPSCVLSQDFVSQMLKAHPGDDGEEGEGYDGPGGVRGNILRVGGVGPLVGQDTEADEPQECPSRCPTLKAER